MTERKLTPEQIELLFSYCERHYVKYYDLQIELVDHLASAIEQKRAETPGLSFEEALRAEFSQFGIYGFGKIKAAKENALHKKYNRLLWQFVGGYFKLPKLLITLAITFALFTLFLTTEKDFEIIGSYVFLFLPFGIAYYYYLFPKYFKIKLVHGKSFLMVDYLKSLQASMLLMLWLPLQVPAYSNLFKLHSFPVWIEFVAALMIAVFTILVYANCFYVPGKIREHLEEQFPQFINS